MSLGWNGLFVGVNNYYQPSGKVDVSKSLLAPGYDADRVANAFRALNTEGDISVLSDTNGDALLPTRNHIFSALVKLLKQTKRTEPFVFYFAGHGGGIGEEYYIKPSDYQSDLPILSSISVKELLDLFYKYRRGVNLLIFDCCRVVAEESRVVGQELNKLPRLVLDEKTAVLWSCGNNQVSLETSLIGEQPVGVFSYYLAHSIYLNYLSDEKDRGATLYDLYELTKSNVSSYVVEEIGGYSQTPVLVGADANDWIVIDGPCIDDIPVEFEFSDLSSLDELLSYVDDLYGVDWVPGQVIERAGGSKGSSLVWKKGIARQYYIQILKELFGILCKESATKQGKRYVARTGKEIARTVGGSAITSAGISAFLTSMFGSVPLAIITTLVTLVMVKVGHRSFCSTFGNVFSE